MRTASFLAQQNKSDSVMAECADRPGSVVIVEAIVIPSARATLLATSNSALRLFHEGTSHIATGIAER